MAKKKKASKKATRKTAKKKTAKKKASKKTAKKKTAKKVAKKATKSKSANSPSKNQLVDLFEQLLEQGRARNKMLWEIQKSLSKGDQGIHRESEEQLPIEETRQEDGSSSLTPSEEEGSSQTDLFDDSFSPSAEGKEAPKASKEDVTQALQNLSTVKGMDACEEVLKAFSASRISDLKEADYDDFIEACADLEGQSASDATSLFG